MTNQDYEQLAKSLQEHGYRKYKGCLTNEDYYWCKGMKYYKDEDGDRRCSYQILYQVWDMNKYPQVPECAKMGVSLRVLISSDYRIDLVTNPDDIYDIKKNETIAQSFYEWAKKEIHL